MRKTIGTFLIAGSLGALCAGLCACSDETVIDGYYKEGNVITVTYDGSGGSILGGENVTLVDMFNPEKYTADANGYVHIKLRAPTDPKRPTSSGNITVTRGEYSLVGWYQSRNPVTVNGKVVDEKGNELVERDGNYYTVRTNDKGETIEEKAVPAYTFSDPWDFSKDTVDFKKGEERLDVTLYAAWCERFTFEYYYKENADDTEWTQFGTTNFDYQQSLSEGSIEQDTLYVPDWSAATGRMEHKHESGFTFPSVSNMTFQAAYSDEACLNRITDSLKHQGSMNYETATPVDPVQKIYVEFEKGNHYKIKTASQFASIGDPTGYYEILSGELDFQCAYKDSVLSFPEGSVKWPLGLMTAEFTGEIVGKDEQGNERAVTFKNIGAQYSSSNATLGGLFGAICDGATIKNVSFQNVVLDIRNATSRFGSSFGTFAGEIDDNAVVEGVTVGGAIRLWSMSISGGNGFHFNLTANGQNEGVTKTEITLMVCGQEITYGNDATDKTGKYEFDIDPREGKTVVDENGNVTITVLPRSNQIERKFEGQYHIVYGGQES